jgi:hypothetical protein
MAGQISFSEKFSNGNIETDGDARFGLYDDAHIPARPLPPFPKLVKVPPSIHAHVGVEDEIAGELHQDVLAAGGHTTNLAAGNRMILVDTVQGRDHGFESRHRTAGECPMECARGAKNRITFGHVSRSFGGLDSWKL